jgi:putative methionine-R-sulfoxide reductase with GAF domain
VSWASIFAEERSGAPACNDSHATAAFDEIDREGLEKVAELLWPHL